MARLFLRALTVFLAVPFFYLVFGLFGGLIPGPIEHTSSYGRDVRIGLARGPIHYDFLLPLNSDARARFGFAMEAGVPLLHPKARWLVLGWGAAEFYAKTAAVGEISVGPLAHAITGDSAVLRLDVARPVDGLPGITFLTLTQGQYDALLTQIEESFARDGDGAPIAAALGSFGMTDAFFEANGQFNIFYTCNTWIGARLRGAGVPMGLWTPTPQSIDLSLWRIRIAG